MFGERTKKMRILVTPAIVAITALIAVALPAVKEARADQVFKPTPEAARAEGVSLAKRIIEARGKGDAVFDNNQCGQFVDYALAPESLTDHASKAIWLWKTQRENWKLQAQAADLYGACEAALAGELEAFILGK
jgi:hypothetical protein